jgi:perosamine synthetase
LANKRLAIDGGEPFRTRPFGPRYDFGEPDKRYLRETIDRAAEGGGWGAAGQVREFEDAFAKRHGVRHAIATDSGTGAIHAAVGAVNPEPGDEIITTPTTDIGTVLGIMLQNAIPVFADWDPDTFNTDPADLERRITDRTRAIIAVHLFGNPCDMDAIMDIGRRHNLVVIEDLSQAHLAEYQGRLVGTIGDIGCLSVGGKTLTAGGGGMIITDDETLARRAMGMVYKGSEFDEGLRNSLRPTSDNPGSSTGYSFLGDYHRMSPLMAAVGRAQLERLDGYTEKRRAAAGVLDDMLWELPGITLQKVRPGDVHTYYVYGYKVDEEVLGVSAEKFAEAVRAEGIPDVHGSYIRGMPLYRFPVFAEDRTYGNSGYPFVDEQGNRRIDYNALHLPVVERELPKTNFILFSSGYSEDDARDIAGAIRKVALHYSSRR